MRFFLVLSLIVIGMWAAGWLTLGREAGRVSVTVEEQKIRLDAAKVVAKCERLLQAANEPNASGHSKSRSSQDRWNL